jgi:sialate O-acetylesterase
MQRMNDWVKRSAAAVLLTLGAAAQADVKPHALFSDNAVLQQQMNVPVWGTAADGEKVTVEFQGQVQSTTASAGRWRVTLQPLPAGGPYTMTIRGQANTVELKNVMVGEVWLLAGQSNMGMGIGELKNAPEIEAASTDPLLRYFQVPHHWSQTPQRDVPAHWAMANPYYTHMISAVGYFFGRELRRLKPDVAIGLVQSAVGGTYADTWIPREDLDAQPQFARAIDRWPRQVAAVQASIERYKQQEPELKKAWEEAAAKARAAGQKEPPAPTPPPGPEADLRCYPSAQYNAMIAPLQPFAIRGACWYQGENDAEDAIRYRMLTMPTLIRAWRRGFERDFPFLIVQLPNYYHITDQPVESAWAEMREAQLRLSQEVPGVATVIAIDCGDEANPLNLHPPKKEPIGIRLASAARVLAYGESIEYSGPIYQGSKIEGERIVIDFTHLGGGLEAPGGALRAFTIAGADRKFVNAQAELRGNQVVVWSPQVPQPVAVRYGWSNNPQGNLWSKAGLPASPFRTDDFPITAKP